MPAGSPSSSVPEDPAHLSETKPAPFDWLLTDIDWLVPCDPAMSVREHAAVAIRGDRIAAIGSSGELIGRFRARKQVSLAGHLVMPGLINTHTHAAMSLFRGLADDLPLQRWLQDVIFPAEGRHMNAGLVYLGTLLSAAEMLRGGITTCCDGYFFEESAARALLDSGARAILGQGVLDFPAPDQPDPSLARDRVVAFAEAFPTAGDRVMPSLFCHAPYTCSAETLQWVKKMCREQNWLFQIHLSETRGEVARLTEQFGERPVFYLDRLGVLDGRTLCAHAVWIEADEITRLAERRVRISHNVQSNMKLASGIAPVPAMRNAGITVGLGTDGCASNNSLDLFQEMDRTAKLHKVATADPTVCPAREVLAMATLQGAVALGLGDRIGSIECGKKADLIALDLRQPHLTPLYDPISHLVYSARGSDVRQVWVDGRQLVRDGRLLTVDVADLLKQTADAAGRIRMEAGKRKKRPPVRSLHQHGPDR